METTPATIAFLSAAAVLVLLVVVLSSRRFGFCAPVDVSWLRATPVAHRGLHDAARDENSLGAFSAAIDHGYAIEFDVQFTSDGVPVVIHDDDLTRLFGLDGAVSNMPLGDLKGLCLPKSGEPVPTLAEALEHVGGRVPLLIEVKDFGLPGRHEETLLRILEVYEGDYAVQSFNPLVCRWFMKHGRFPVGLLLDDVPTLDFGWFRNLKDNIFSALCAPNFIAYNYGLVDEGISAAYRAQHVTVLGWVVYDEDLVSGAYRRYVDNAIFEARGVD